MSVRSRREATCAPLALALMPAHAAPRVAHPARRPATDRRRYWFHTGAVAGPYCPVGHSNGTASGAPAVEAAAPPAGLGWGVDDRTRLVGSGASGRHRAARPSEGRCVRPARLIRRRARRGDIPCTAVRGRSARRCGCPPPEASVTFSSTRVARGLRWPRAPPRARSRARRTATVGTTPHAHGGVVEIPPSSAVARRRRRVGDVSLTWDSGLGFAARARLRLRSAAILSGMSRKRGGAAAPRVSRPEPLQGVSAVTPAPVPVRTSCAIAQQNGPHSVAIAAR